MPRKLFYTQGLAILLRQAMTLDAIESCLSGFTIVSRREESTDWRLSGPSLVIAYKPEVNGYVLVDIVDHRWPDQMGDPKTEPELFGAWHLGQFGPGTWPGSLRRACEHSWAWPDGHSVPLQHQAFIRIRSSYNFGQTESPIILPENYDAVHELRFVTRIAAALVRLPQVICYFNPSGECVRGASQFLECLSDDHASTADMPLWVWSNVRFFKVPNTDPVWNLMDTVGLSQLDAPDHEAFFQSTAYEPGEVDAFLRIMSSYIVAKGPIIKHGDTADGPGNVKWQGFHVSEALIGPTRSVIRWFPLDRRKIPAELAKGPAPKLMSWKETALWILGVRHRPDILK
jgi:hypothetical protein